VTVTDRYAPLSLSERVGQNAARVHSPGARPCPFGDGLPVPVTGARTHWHRFRWAGDDAFSGSSLYACRCGVVRPAP